MRIFWRKRAESPMEPISAEEDAAALCYTSGTTGCPKGVLYSHRAIALHSLAISLPDQLNFSRNDTDSPDRAHVPCELVGLSVCRSHERKQAGFAWMQPQAGGTARPVAERRGDAGRWCSYYLDGVLNTLENNPGRWKLAPGLRLTVGGSAAPESLFRRFDKLGVHLVHAWGMTETTPVGTAATLKPHMHSWTEDDRYAQRAKQGLPLPFIETRTVGDQGEAARDGITTGEFQVRGPWIAGSYYNLDQADKWTDDGWFRTGDVGTIDSEGYLKITDRLKDLIKSGGEWISSVDLENALVAHEAVREAAVIAVPHSKWQERPLALVILKEGFVVDASELRTFLERRFPRWHVPDGFVFVNELAHTSTGKLLKSKLRQDFGHPRGALLVGQLLTRDWASADISG